MDRRRTISLLVQLFVAEVAIGASLLFSVNDQGSLLLGILALAITGSLGFAALRSLAREAAVRDESGRVKRDILGSVSHELRTPLNAILGYAEILETMPELSPEEEDHMVARIFSNAVTLTCAVNNLIEYSAAIGGQTAVRRSLVRVGELIEEIEPWVDRLIDEKSIAFNWTVDDAVPAIHIDRGKLRHIMLNLLANAAKFTDSGEIRLTAAWIRSANARTSLEITITDTGQGMDADARGRIFEEFYYGPDSPMHSRGGIGLGLTLARWLTDRLGGSIAVASAPDRGTMVTLSLPALLADEAEAIKPSASTVQPGEDGRNAEPVNTQVTVATDLPC
jgi:signal transduction histidine kinase